MRTTVELNARLDEQSVKHGPYGRKDFLESLRGKSEEDCLALLTRRVAEGWGRIRDYKEGLDAWRTFEQVRDLVWFLGGQEGGKHPKAESTYAFLEGDNYSPKGIKAYERISSDFGIELPKDLASIKKNAADEQAAIAAKARQDAGNREAKLKL